MTSHTPSDEPTKNTNTRDTRGAKAVPPVQVSYFHCLFDGQQVVKLEGSRHKLKNRASPKDEKLSNWDEHQRT